MKINVLSKIRQFLVILFIIIIAVVLYLKVIPFGKASYERSYSQILKSGKGFIYGFTPVERLNTDNLAKIIGDPVYFSVFTPRTFDTAKVIVTYRDNLSDATPIIEGGVLADKLVWRYDLKPIENKTIERLKEDWSYFQDGDVLLLQREKNYDDWLSFTQDLKEGQIADCTESPIDCIAFYHYSENFEYKIPNWIAEPLVIDTPLRGLHQFYLYVNNGLTLQLELVDLNQDKGQDPITVNVYKNNELIIQKYLDDNNPSPTSGILEEKMVTIKDDKIEEGVYKVEVKISDDIVIKKITSSTNKLSFLNKVWPVSTSGDITLFTTGDYLQVKALNPASRQTISFAEEEFSVDEIYKQFNFLSTNDDPVKRINFAKDDIILENNSVFAWDIDSLFNPGLIDLDSQFKLDKEINYIIAAYQSPVVKDGWKTASLEFNLKSAYREKGKYSFIISVPGLKAEDDLADYIEIDKIRIEFEGRTLWQKVKSWF